ncbi:MAG: helix-hairpin-helix domain-containing protein [Lachnospiraceae bacterium]|nr:helix-hairpin-helix domain-containing protein [Lachnospiraceae bacterium]
MKTIFNLIVLLICTFLCVTLSGCSITQSKQIKYGNGEYYDSSGIYAHDGIKASAETEDLYLASNSTEISNAAISEAGAGPNTITVCILGEVIKPGVYILPEGSRVYELINEAGGTTGDAYIGGLNFVAGLKDGNQIIIPKIQEDDGRNEGDNKKIDTVNITHGNLGNYDADIVTTDSSEGRLVNINQANLAELMNLPGIGETRAKAIIAYRDANGPFEKIEDVMKVSGIKSGTYKGFCDLICVN